MMVLALKILVFVANDLMILAYMVNGDFQFLVLVLALALLKFLVFQVILAFHLI